MRNDKQVRSMRTSRTPRTVSPVLAGIGPLAAAASLALFSTAPFLIAQSDNFDSGSLSSAWTVVPYPGAPTLTFPDALNGKAVRVQAVTGGLCFFYQNPVYTNFYVAMDMVAWDNTLDQAGVLIARAQNIDTIVNTTGYICNFDPNQNGSGATDRLGGEFQINRVDGLQSINTIAAAEVRIEPGRPYRLVFTGVGKHFTGRLYDYFDLTQPIATIEVEDDTYTNGNSGFVSYARDSSQPTDMTFDNYVARDSDPDADIAPAIRFPVAGTPEVVSRTPAARFTNFVSPDSDLTFTVNTFGTNLIGFPARLYLNGTEAFLLPNDPAPVTNVTFNTMLRTLQPNTLYSARLELQDAAGMLKSTNTFWFDTFSDSFISTPPAKTIEIEDYNYWDGFNDGLFQLDPIPVSGLDATGSGVVTGGGGYYALQGTEGIDFHDTRTGPESGWDEYRYSDPVGTIQGGKDEIQDMNHPSDEAPPSRPNDHQRQKYVQANLPEYEVAHTDPGEWLDYTRVFAPTNYNVFLRVASFSATEAELDLVGGDTSTSNQTATALGRFEIPNDLMRINYRYVPLTATNGMPATVALGGTNTVRLSILGTPSKDSQVTYLNYLLFVPVASASLTLMSSSTLSGPYSADTTATIDSTAKTVTVPLSGATRFYRLQSAPPALTITSVKIAGGNLVLTY